MMENSNNSYKHYRERLDFIGTLGMDDRSNSIVQAVVKDIEDVSYISTSKFLKLLDAILYIHIIL